MTQTAVAVFVDRATCGPERTDRHGSPAGSRGRVCTFLLPTRLPGSMTAISFDEHGVDVVYQGTEFRLEKSLIEEAVGKAYPDVTDHEVLKLIEENPALSGEPRRVADILD